MIKHLIFLFAFYAIFYDASSQATGVAGSNCGTVVWDTNAAWTGGAVFTD